MGKAVIVLSLMLQYQADASFPAWKGSPARMLANHSNGSSPSPPPASNASSSNCPQGPSSEFPPGLSAGCSAVAGNDAGTCTAGTCTCASGAVECTFTMTDPEVTCTGDTATCDTVTSAMTSSGDASSQSDNKNCVPSECDNTADLNTYLVHTKSALDAQMCNSMAGSLPPGITMTMQLGLSMQCPSASGAVSSSGTTAAPKTSTSKAGSHVLPLASLTLLLCAWAEL